MRARRSRRALLLREGWTKETRWSRKGQATSTVEEVRRYKAPVRSADAACRASMELWGHRIDSVYVAGARLARRMCKPEQYIREDERW